MWSECFASEIFLSPNSDSVRRVPSVPIRLEEERLREVMGLPQRGGGNDLVIPEPGL